MWRAFLDAFKIPELRMKILFTLGALAVYRLGAAIPTPGVDASSLSNNLQGGNLGGVLGILGLVSGGSLEQFSIFALGVLPYITASIVMQIMTTAIPALEKMQKEGPEGSKRINQYTRMAAIGLAAVQAFFFANLLQSQGTFVRIGWNPAIFMLVLVITQMAGCAFTMWLGERITEYGIGNGISMIIFAGIVHRFPIEFQQTFALMGTQFDLLAVIFFFTMIVLVIGLIVLVQQGERRIPVQYARKVSARAGGAAASAANASFIPLKINTAGVIPVIFSSSILSVIQIIPNSLGNPVPVWAQTIADFLRISSPTGLFVEVLLIIGFTYFYTSITFDPKRVAENLREQGGFIPGVRPGADTQGHLERISGRITLWGALFLGALAIIPTVVQNITNVTTFPLAGTTLLIVVGVALDTLKQLESQLAIRNYGGFLQKGKLRGRGGFQQ
jgi:preprotein translocase subunit SecY